MQVKRVGRVLINRQSPSCILLQSEGGQRCLLKTVKVNPETNQQMVDCLMLGLM